MKALKPILILLNIFVCFVLLAQPANDNCADAISLSIGLECSSTQYTTVGATAEDVLVAANPGCNYYQGADVWFSFTVPVSGDFRIELNSSWELYTGTCSNFSPIWCDAGNQNFRKPALAGETLYLRSFRYNSASGENFNLCIWEPEMQANDYCADAIDIPVGQECSIQEFSSKYSTGETTDIAPFPGCGYYKNADVWFTFTVPTSGDFRIELNSNWELYTGTCGDFSAIWCDNGNQNFREPALAGQTLYLRSFRYNSEEGADFTLCIWEPEMQINDYCADAIDIPVGQECSTQEFSSKYSTGESTDIAPIPGCGYYKNADVWFTFTAPPSGDFRIELNSNWELYTGSCGDFSPIWCDSGNQNFRESTLAGQTLYLRSFRYNSEEGADFTLCIWEPEMQINDYCADAIDIPVGQECSLQEFSSKYSTRESTDIAPDPSCGYFKNADVWFTFTVPVSGDFRIELSSSWALYTGSCGDFLEFNCNSGNMNFSNPTLAGETLYLRAFRYNSEEGQDFTLCIWEPDVPENNLCENATNIILNDSCNAQSFSSRYSTSEDLSIAQNPSCGYFKGGDVWFTFTAPESGQFALERTSNSNGGTAQFAFYTGTCGDFEEFECSGAAEINFNDPSLGGQEIYVRSFAYNNRAGSDFDFCIKNTTIAQNDNCADAISLNVGESCTFETFNNFNTTSEGGLAPTPTCGYFQGGDVWFTFDVPSTGQFQINRNNISGGTFYYALYTGSCGSFIEYDCSSDPTQSLYDAPELANQTVYLRAFRYHSAFGGEFEMCIVAGDCSGTLGGTAFLDECETCVGGNTGLEACVEDCNGEFGGTAYLDNCQTCVGGNTELEPCIADCNGDFGGSAYLDDCETCVGGNTELEPCVFDCPALEANIGDGCDDGDPETENDVITEDCGCAGTITFDCPALEANIGDGCDDGNPETENDVITEDCGCEGTITFDCPTLEANIGDGCDDGDPETENDVVTEDCGCAGTLTFDCPALEANIGDGCDDGDPETENDVVTEDCECVGANFCNDPQPAVTGMWVEFVEGEGVLGHWDAVPYSIACQHRLYTSDEVLINKTTQYGFELDNYLGKTGLFDYGTVFIWAIRCGCNDDPVIAGPWSTLTFTTPSEPSLISSPNPTSGESNVTFEVVTEGHTTLEVFDMNGRSIEVLYNGMAGPSTEYSFQFNGSSLPTGVYIYRLTTESNVVIEKFMIAK